MRRRVLVVIVILHFLLTALCLGFGIDNLISKTNLERGIFELDLGVVAAIMGGYYFEEFLETKNGN